MRAAARTRDAPAGRPVARTSDNPWLLPGEVVVATDGLASAHHFGYCEHRIEPRVKVAAIRFVTGDLRAAFARAPAG